MFNKNVYAMLQLLHSCVTQIQFISGRDQQRKFVDLYPSHILNGLKTVQTSLRENISQYIRFVSKIHTQVATHSDQETQEFSNRQLNLEELEIFIEQALTRKKLDQIPMYSQEAETLLNQACFNKFPSFQKEINHRRQSIRQIQQINHNLQTLQRNLQLQSCRQQKTLDSILTRIQNINLSIRQSEKQLKNQKKSIQITDFIKHHNQTERILNFIVQGNVCFMEEIAAQMQGCQFKTLILKIIEQMKKCDSQTQTIYSFLYSMGKTNKQQMSCRFLRSINYFNLSQKLNECIKLISFLKRNSIQQYPTITVSNQVDCTLKTPAKTKQSVEQIRQQIVRSETQHFQKQMLLLQQAESIYELEYQLKILKLRTNQLQTQKQDSFNLISKLNETNNSLQVESQNLKLQISHLTQRQKQLINQNQQSIQIIDYVQIQNQKLKEQLVNAIEQYNRKIKANQTLKHQNWQHRATIEQQKALIQNTNLNLQAAQITLAEQKSINQEHKRQNLANKQSIVDLKKMIQQSQNKLQKEQNLLQCVSNIYHICIQPTYNHISSHCQQDQFIQKNNIGEMAFEESLSQTSSNIQQQNKGKLSMRHAKSFSSQNYNEFMSWNLNKKEESHHSNQSEQLQKNISNKDKTIKKYEIFINRYKNETKKYQKEILDLQAKTKKLELQILQLNQIVEERNIHKELLSIQEEPNDIHNLEMSQQALQQSNIEKLTQKEAELRVKEESINFKIQGIINTVLQLNAFRTQTKQSTHNSLMDAQLYELGLDSFNPQSNS